MIHQTPILESQASTGKAKFWHGIVEQDDDGPFYYSEHWQDGVVKQQSAKVRVTGKQKRSDVEQAIFEITSKMQQKMDKGYVIQGAEDTEVRPPILPMLAHDYAKRKKDLTFPCYVQPKENGFRALYDGKQFWTRQGNTVDAQVVQHLHIDIPEGVVLDGELVLLTGTFQDTVRTIKKYRGDDAPKVEYRVYDCFHHDIPEMIFEDRYQFLANLNVTHAHFGGPVFLVKTDLVNNEGEMMAMHAYHVQQLVEGTMARNVNGLYKPGHRSVDLLKIKDMMDSEFEIVGFTDGRGKEDNAIIFECITPEGMRFMVRPKGTYEERINMFYNGHDYVGKMLTVKYQSLSEDSVPVFPVGLIVRDYE